jgi:hypothetical protein
MKMTFFARGEKCGPVIGDENPSAASIWLRAIEPNPKAEL